MAHVQTLLAAAVVVAAIVLLGLLWEHGVLAEMASRVMNRARRRGQAEPGGSTVSNLDGRPVPGTSGRAVTALRPRGRVVVAGVEYEAKSQFGFIEAGKDVRVVGEDAGVLTVRVDREQVSALGGGKR